ncbi:MAG: glycoside hydrolase family 1 protein [Deltaproteobacteria bacterium]|nr:glycoside hydrolase family 1 protein [Deltaproteobacteria bacterium]
MDSRSRGPSPLRRFLWGVATSAFQVEGASRCDWTTWKVKDEPDRLARLRGVGHRERTDEDLALLSSLGVNAYRFSIEWSRVAPRPDEWDRKAMDRYVRIAARLRESGIEPVVTLHHFTNPAWLANGAPWADGETVGEFLRFAEKAVRALREHVRLWVTFNEPNVFVTGGYLGGIMPPGKRSVRDGFNAYANILKAHAAVYDAIHAAAREAPAVGLAHNMVVFRPASENSPLDNWASKVAHAFYNLSLIEAFRTGTLSLRLPFLHEEAFPVGTRGKLDFLGVNYYFRLFLRLSPINIRGPEYFWEDRSGRGLTETGWEVYPKGFEETLRVAASSGLPIVVTENGAAETDDGRKIAFMRDHFRVLHRMIREGMDIRGYFWWSLMDNYEWLEGLRPRFGLYRVDFRSLERISTESAAYYARWIMKHPDPSGVRRA